MAKDIKPLFDHVILEFIEDKKSLIVLPGPEEEAKAKSDQFRVVAIGPDVKHIHVGDRVIFRCPHFVVELDGAKIFFNREVNACIAEREV